MRLTDTQWERLEPLLLGKQGDPGVSGKNNRQFIEAVLWVSTHSDLWRNLPVEFGKWNTVYMRFKRWNECDVWRQVAEGVADDSELHAMLRKVVEYGDKQTRRIRQRLARQARRDVYNNLIESARVRPPNDPFVDVEDSTAHWLALVADDAIYNGYAAGK